MRSSPTRLAAGRRGLLLWLVFAIGCLLSFGAAWQQHRVDRARMGREVGDELQALANRVNRQVLRVELGLLGVRGAALTVGWDALNRAAFARYNQSRDLGREFPGIHGMGVVRRVPPEREAAFVAASSADGWPGFAIRYLAPHDSERFVIQYVEPVEGNRAAVGLDIASEDNRRSAALAALRTGQVTLTGPILLIQATGPPRQRVGFLMLLPVYPDARVAADVEHRADRALGWVYAPLVIQEVLSSLEFDSRRFRLRIADVGAGPPQMFYASTDDEPAAGEGLVTQRDEAIAGRVWRIELSALPGFFADQGHHESWEMAFAGVLLSALLAGGLRGYYRSKDHAKELQVERDRRAAALQTSRDAIVMIHPQGEVFDWNQGAEALFGYTAGDIVGRSGLELLVPPERQEEAHRVLALAALGETLPAFDTQRLDNQGRLIDVSALVIPLRDPDGALSGLALSMRDIRSAKQAEREIQQLGASLQERATALGSALTDVQSTLDAVPAIVAYWDTASVFVRGNRAWHQQFGAEAQERVCAPDLLGPLSPSFPDSMASVLAGRTCGFECTLGVPGGLGVWHAQMALLPDIRDGRVVGYHTVLQDITQQIADKARLARALRESDAFLSTVHTHALVSVTDRSGCILDANANFCRVAQYSRDELIGQNHRLLKSGVHRREFWAGMWETIGQGRSWRGEICNRARDGSLYWVDSMIAPIPGADGQMDRYIAIRTDITERHEAEQTLHQTMTLLNSVLDAASEIAIIATDTEGRIQLFNRGAERLLGFDAQAVIGQLKHLSFIDRAEIVQRREELARLRGRPASVADVFTDPAWMSRSREWTFVRRDGRPVPVTMILTPMAGPDSAVTGYLAVALDITQRREFEHNLEQATARAEAANLAKSAFLANMSHEIRTPLNAVLGLTYLLHQTVLNDEQRAFLDRIKLVSDVLLQTINDVLDISKVEAGELTLTREPFCPAETVGDLVAVMGVHARSKDLPIRLVRAATLPRCLLGDSVRLTQVLTNLLSNAVKFTERGEIRLDVDWQADGDRHGTARFRVSDTGIGLEAAAAQRIFEPFVQAEITTTRRFGGTGLGLSIVRQLVGLMRGQLGVDSHPGVGSTFWVDIPFEVCTDGQSQRVLERVLRSDALAGKTILVVDDSDINRDVARRIIERKGAQVILAEDGAQAVEALRVNPSRIDLVLMDIHMPVMDGFEATRIIRRELHCTGLPILVLTAGATTEERARAQEAGVDDFITKPFDPNRLLFGIAQRLGVGGAVVLDSPDGRGADNVAPVAEWPSIDGVETVQARQRLGDDQRLFSRLLGRLFALGLPVLPQADQPDDPAGLDQAVRSVHLLSGNAGTLGMTRLHAQAVAIESCLRQGDLPGGRALLDPMRDEWTRLQAACAPFLAGSGDPGDPDPGGAKAPAESLTDEQFQELRSLLLRRSLRAMATLELRAPALQARLGVSVFHALKAAVYDLRFAQAVALLDEADSSGLNSRS